CPYRRVSEDVRMPSHHLVDQLSEQIRHREVALLLGDARVEDDLKQQVAELLAHGRAAAGLDCLQDFVGFLDEKGLERRWGLFAIPRAAARFTESLHDVQEPLKENTGGVGHFRS